MISSDTYGKDPIKTNDIINRINILNNLGFTVVICRSGFYNDNITRLKMDRNYHGRLFFIVGSDALKRIIETTNFSNTYITPLTKTNFIHIKRPGTMDFKIHHQLTVFNLDAVFDYNVSSTMIRGD